MATEAGELVIKIAADTEQIKAALSDMSKRLNGTTTAAVASGVTLGITFTELGKKVIRFGFEAVQAYGEQELSLARLARQVGQDTANAFAEYAEELQHVSLFTDESIVAMQAQLAAFGLYPGSVKGATLPLMDFAAATGKSLPEAANVLRQALSGNSRELNAMGLSINQADSKSEKLEKTVKFLNDRFGGMSKQLKETDIGTIQNFTIRIDELKEKIGKDLVQAIRFWEPAAAAMLAWMEKLIGAAKNDKTVRQLTIDKLTEEKEELLANAKARMINHGGIALLTAAEQERLIGLTDQLVILKKKETQEAKTAAAGKKSKEDEKKGVQELVSTAQDALNEKIAGMQRELEVAKLTQGQITAITKMETDLRILAAQNQWEANASFSDQMRVKLTQDLTTVTAQFADMAMGAINNFGSAIGKMIVEGQRFKDVIKAFWKQLAEEIIAQIARMIAKWIVFQAITGGGGIGGRFFGGMATGGMVNEPSVLTGMRSGRSHFVGEAGPEMIVPTSGGGNYNESFGPGEGPGGGGGQVINVSISGQFLEGSPQKWQRMIREVFSSEIKRYTASNPSGSFNRRRGAA